MRRAMVQGSMPPEGIIPRVPRRSYLVTRRQDRWFIAFEGEEFGPYQTEREALLFAVDAAQKFGEQGQDTQVLRTDEHGEGRPVWTYGIDPYPLTPE